MVGFDDAEGALFGAAGLTGAVVDPGEAGVGSVEIALVTVAASAAGAPRDWVPAIVEGDRWSSAIPTGLEDLYQIDIRATDALGNITMAADVWRGIIDTAAPVLTARVTATGATNAQGDRVELEFECIATDRFLDEDSFDCAGSPLREAERTFDQDPLLMELFPDLANLVGMRASFRTWSTSADAPASLRACDLYGNCADSGTPAPPAVAARLSKASQAMVLAAAVPTVQVLYPAVGQHTNGTARVVVDALAADGLGVIDVYVDGVLVATEDLADRETTVFEGAIPLAGLSDGPHDVVATVTSSTGETGTSSYVSFVRDTDTPVVAIDEVHLTGDDTWSTGTDMFVVSGDVTDGGTVGAVQGRVDGGPWADALVEGGRWSLAVQLPDADGRSFDVTVRAVDLAGNAGSIDLVVDVDLAPVGVGFERPETTIAGCDGCDSGDRVVDIWFASTAGTNAVSGFECRIDGADPEPCSSPWTVEGHSTGLHSVEVTAVDVEGLADLSPATRTWSVDQIGVQPVVSGQPDDPTTSRSAQIMFAAAEAATFECSFDWAEFTECDAPFTAAGLSLGDHVFDVRAVVDGTVGTAVRTAWTIVNEAPQVANSLDIVRSGDGVDVTAEDVDPVQYRIVDQPVHGYLEGAAPNFRYVAHFGYIGPDSFTFVADDGLDTSDVATAYLYVTDGVVFPEIELPAEVDELGVLEAETEPGFPYATVEFELSVLDPDDPTRPLEVTCVEPSGSQFPIGSSTVECSTEDVDGNVATASFQVSVLDRELPVFDSVEDQTVYPDAPGVDPVVFVEPSATDNSGVVSVECD
ncbi:MAG: HYR domain-containing protein, partial [Ilumatobacteraceae bacterium]